MPVTLDLSENALTRLEAEAARRGVSIEVIIDELASRLPVDSRPNRTLGLIGLGSSTSGRTASEADKMLAEGFGQS